MADGSQEMIAFLGVPADRRLLNEDLFNLPAAEQRREPEIATEKHDRLVAAGSLLTGVSLIGGAAMALYGGWQVLFNGGGVLDAVVAVIGILLVATHWGWVHVAEYAGLTIDEHQQRANDDRARACGCPRFSLTRASASPPACSTTPPHVLNASDINRS